MNDDSFDHVIELPKLTTITSIPEARNSGTTFKYPRQVTIDCNCSACALGLAIPFLHTVYLSKNLFQFPDHMVLKRTIIAVTLSIELGDKTVHPFVPVMIHSSFVCTESEITAMDLGTTHIVIADECGQDYRRVFDLSHYRRLREVIVGDNCLNNVEGVSLIGLKHLERVVIGKNSFTRHKSSYASDSTHHFTLKDCVKVKELKIGSYSFSDFGLITVENNPFLQTIEIGDVNDWSYNFYSASLELKSSHDDNE